MMEYLEINLYSCIPVESVTHFMEHIQNLVNKKQSDGESLLTDFNKKPKKQDQV